MGILEQDSLTIASFTFAAIYVFVPSVPVTHCLGLVAHFPRSAKAKHLLLYPFKGGRHHFIFQVIAWVSTYSLFPYQERCKLILRPRSHSLSAPPMHGRSPATVCS